MVSGLGSHVKLLSTELALKAIQTHDSISDNVPSPCEGAPEPVSVIDAKNSSEPSTSSSETIPTTGQPDSQLAFETRIATPAFMMKLKAQLLELYRNSDSSSQAGAMLHALGMGTLKIFDPIEGFSVTARDVSTSARGQQSHQVGEISALGWSQFLKERVKRAENGTYLKDADGHYIDAVSGESAYFETVENKYYYFTWP